MLEAEYISETPIKHRKDYGQFFTPPSIARLMVQWVLKSHPQTVLDPAFGLGIFYDEIIQANPEKTLEFTGYEIDQNIIDYLNNNNDDEEQTNLKIIHSDYLEIDLENFDGIICNPPYMRFQKFLKRHEILPKIEQQIGKKLGGYSNLSSIFLVKALHELNPHGNLAFIMPFEFFNTGYGKEIKKSLLNDNLLKQIIIFSNEKDLFPEVITTVCILLCRKDGQKEPIKITQIKTDVELHQISDISHYYQKTIELSDLPFSQKWTPILLSLFSEQVIPEGFVKLSFYGSFTRGIATGANNFFSLNKSQIKRWNLDDENICKCITKSSQIRQCILTEDDYNNLSNSDQAVYCLDVRNSPNQHILRYIEEGEKKGYHQRYLTSKKSPWYKIESRQPAPLLLGVFNRGRVKVIRNFTTAINFTCFHAFYPNVLGENLIDKLFIYLLSDQGQKILKMNKRSYGDQLDKFEPGDVNECFCPSLNQWEMIEEQEVKKVIEIARKDENLAIKMSNNLVQLMIKN